MRRLLLTFSLVLCLVAAGLSLPITQASAANTETVTFSWTMSGRETGYYNPADKGKEVTIPYFLLFNGTDENGNFQTLRWVAKQYTGKIGEDSSEQIPVDSITDIQNKKFTNCTFVDVYVPINSRNYIYSGSSKGSAGQVGISFSQNMNTQLQTSQAPDSLILPADEGNIPIRYTVEQISGGTSTYPLKNRSGDVIANTSIFSAGAVNLWADRYADDFSFNRALVGDQLDMYSAYTGKYKGYKLHAEFAGENKAELAKRYTLTVTGDDLTGWSLTLGSKLMKGVKEVIEDIDYVTNYEDDPSLPVGQTKVKRAGVVGKSITSTPYYYVINEQGEEEVVQMLTDEATTETIAPVDEIVLKGIKKADEANKQIRKPNQAKNLPKTGDTGLNGLMGAGALLLAAAGVGAALRRPKDS